MARKSPNPSEELIELDGSLLNEDQRYRMKVYELVEKFQDAVPYLQSDSHMRRLVAGYGEAYFFFDKKGDLCCLTDFVKDPEEEEI